MKASDIMHPEDAKALQMLRKIKGFDAFIRASMEYGYEQVFRGENLGMMVKVNAQNYPSLYAAFKNVVLPSMNIQSQIVKKISVGVDCTNKVVIHLNNKFFKLMSIFFVVK